MKDRLDELRKLQQQTNKDVEKGLKNHQIHTTKDGPGEKSSLLDPFFNEVESIQEELNNLKEDIEKIQKIHSFLLNAKEPDKKKIQQETSQLDDLNYRIKKTSVSVKNKLKELKESNETMSSEIQSNGSSNGNNKRKLSGAKSLVKLTPTELRIRETQVAYLHKLFINVMTDHSTSQSDYNDRHKKLMRAHMEVIGINKTDEEFDKMMADSSFQDDLFTEGLLRKTADAKQALAEVNARHKIIVQIEQSLVEVHDLFVQMASMVEQQGDMIDVIERNVVRAAEASKSGQAQLKEAKMKASAATKKKIFCYGILAAVTTFLIVAACIF